MKSVLRPVFSYGIHMCDQSYDFKKCCAAHRTLTEGPRGWNCCLPFLITKWGNFWHTWSDKSQLRGWLVLCAGDCSRAPEVRKECSGPPSLCPAPARHGSPTAPRLLTGAALRLRGRRLGLSFAFFGPGEVSEGPRGKKRGRDPRGGESTPVRMGGSRT